MRLPINLIALITFLATLIIPGIEGAVSSSSEPAKSSVTGIVQRKASKTGEAEQSDKAHQIAKTTEEPDVSSRVALDVVNGLIRPAFQKTNRAVQERHNDPLLGKKQAQEILDQALLVANTIDSTRYKAEALINLAASYHGIKQTYTDLTDKQTIQKETNRILEILALAQEAANTIKKADEKATILGKIASQYTVLDRWEQASKILAQAVQVTNTIENSNDRAKVLYQLTDWYLEPSRILSSILTFTGIELPKQDSLEATQQKLKRLAPALQIANTVEVPNYKAKALAEIADGYTELNQYEQSLQIAQDLKDNTLKGKVLAQMVERNQRRPEIFYQVLQIANAVEDADGRDSVLSAISHGCVSISMTAGKAYVEADYEQALEIANTIKNTNIKAKALAAIALKIANNSRYLVGSTIELSPQQFEQLPQDARLRILNDTMAKSGKPLYDKAFEIINSIEVTSIKAEALGKITVNLFEKEIALKAEYSQALQVADTIEVTSIKAKALAKIAELYVERNRYTARVQKDKNSGLLSQVLYIAQNPNSERALRPMIAILYLNAGQYDRALQVANAIENGNTRTKILVDIANRYEKIGELNKADNILSQALQVAESINDANKKAEKLLAIAQAYISLKQYYKGSEILHQARQTAQSIKNNSQTIKSHSEKDEVTKIQGAELYESEPHNRTKRLEEDKDLLWSFIDSQTRLLKLYGKYQLLSAKSFNRDVKKLVAQNKIVDALEMVERERGRSLIDIISKPLSQPLPPPPTIEQIRQIARQHNATLVKYAIIYEDYKGQKTQISRESELFIWVVKPSGKVAFRRVSLSKLWQENNLLTDLVSNSQLFARGLVQELKTQKNHLGLIALIIFIAGGVGGTTVWYRRKFLTRKPALTSSQNSRFLGIMKRKNISKKEVKFLFSYTSKDDYVVTKSLIRWLLLFLAIAGGSAGILFGVKQSETTLANRIPTVSELRNDSFDSLQKRQSLNYLQNQPISNQETYSLLEKLVSNTREYMGVRGRGLALVPKKEKFNQTNRLQQLHQLLIQPIADLLPTDANAQVVFIPTGSLFFVPFPALQDSKGKYLIQQHTILTAPSIQTLDLTRQKRQQIKQSKNNNVLVVGNPTMPILVSPDGKPPSQLPSLPGAEREAKAIASLLNTKPIIGSSATEPMVLSQMLKARIIHLATHGLLDPIYKWRNSSTGVIALTPLQDNSAMLHKDLEHHPVIMGRDVVDYTLLDGFLFSEDIAHMQLRAELVVLSACDTGLGELSEDGVIGLSRFFIVAGVPSVIVSLWSVPDAPTASLMTEFYQNLQKNPDKAQALRQAMLTTMKQHPDPKDWAAFTLIGEAK